MAFVNEKIPEQDRGKFAAVINYENLRKQARYIPEFRSDLLNLWAIDRVRGVYVIFVTGGGREQLEYYVLVMDGQPVVFNVDQKIMGHDSIGLQEHWSVYDLLIPPSLESRREEIKQLIREALEEKAYLRATADGGTFANPNTVARGNIISFEVEFK
ncbi:hypothetical protein PL263_13875 [Methylomonas sp. EFPC3]|uniref:hypothetical protein n=1 Tax=Methylomonas sp. EFPC3 TaxID=3021710 RepID=UPI002415DDAF|nr:hypothetical protein [Methylomonas sp. EFPC3]WFP49182.1 hypothetical protein PL263_13875 [Methylomonas sp. EFPC3]